MKIIVVPDGAPICCCGPQFSRCSACADLAGKTLWAVINRVGGDWSDCGAGQWEDGEEVTLAYQGISGATDPLCENRHTWSGSTACGDTLTICCDPDNDVLLPDGNSTAGWWFWWCDPVSAYTGESSCFSGVWTIGDYGIGDGIGCSCDTGTFTITIHRSNPS